MPAPEPSEEAFKEALEIIRRGDFDEVKEALQGLGFEFKPTGDPNHWMYWHPLLREDEFFRSPRNLYRQHGARRSSDRITKRDAQQARQIVHVLRDTLVAQSGETSEDE